LFDEIYALSVFDYALTGLAKEEQPDNNPFISVLSIPNIEQYCEKELVHVAYGMSKVSASMELDVGFLSLIKGASRYGNESLFILI
jgi:hypothetical protein